MKFVWYLSLILTLPLGAEQAPPANLAVSLAGVEKAVLEHSPILQSARLQSQAAGEAAWATFTGLLPRLSIAGNWRYQTVVPTLSFPIPGLGNVPFGDNTNYSIGAQVDWNVWDTGATFNQWRAAKALQKSQDSQADLQQRTLILQARQDYFQVQSALAQVQLLADDLRLSQQQAHDIGVQLAAGSSSRIDDLSARNDVVQKTIALRQARAQLSGALRDLFALTGLGGGADPTLAVGEDWSGRPPSGVEAPSLVLSLDQADDSEARLRPAEAAGPDLDNPRIMALEFLAQAANSQAWAAWAGHWPRGSAMARNSLDYPDGPILSKIEQITYSGQVSWPIFSWGQVMSQVAQQDKLAEADGKQAEQARTDLQRDWQKAMDQLASLRSQQQADALAVRQSTELQQLVESSYKAGNSSYLDVQSATVRALSSRVRESQTRIQILMQLAVLDSLAKRP